MKKWEYQIRYINKFTGHLETTFMHEYGCKEATALDAIMDRLNYSQFSGKVVKVSLWKVSEVKDGCSM